MKALEISKALKIRRVQGEFRASSARVQREFKASSGRVQSEFRASSGRVQGELRARQKTEREDAGCAALEPSLLPCGERTKKKRQKERQQKRQKKKQNDPLEKNLGKKTVSLNSFFPPWLIKKNSL